MSETVVTATSGRPLGSRPSRRLRAQGQLPGVVYGLKKDPISVSVTYTELRDALKTEAGLNTVFQLDVDGTKETVLVRSVERDPIKQTVIHADFMRLDPTKKVKIKIPIHLVGEATAVTSEGAMVEQKMFEIEVEASPLDIPNEIQADLSMLTLENRISVADLVFPEQVIPQVPDVLSVVIPVMARAAKLGEDEEGEEGELVEGEEGAEDAEAESDESSGSGEE